MSHDGPIRLLIADDHEVARCGVRALLSGSGVDIVGEVASGPAAVAFILESPVDVILMDIRMPGGDGLAALGHLKLDRPNLAVVMFSNYENPAFVARSVALGASGYLVKSCSREKLIQTIHAAARGENAFTRDELRRVTGALATPRLPVDVEVPLTHREGQVLQHLACGKTNKQIAEELHIGYETVKEHVQHILRKIGLADRTQAAVWAVRRNLV
jgi:DNA-binding NarL/FixJ family response regulator